jgi:hypothetical protein
MDTFKERRQFRIQKLKQQRLAAQGLGGGIMESTQQQVPLSVPIPSHPLDNTCVDKHVLRQLKNRESAIRSRKRKDEQIEDLSDKVARLERENIELKRKLQCVDRMTAEGSRAGVVESGNNYGLASYLRGLAPTCA